MVVGILVEGRGDGDGPRVHTGIVTPLTPHPSYLRQQQIPVTPPFSRHSSSTILSFTTIYSTHYPPGENSSVLCIRVHACVCMCSWVCACSFACISVHECVCMCAWGCITTPPIRPGPENPSRIHFIYVYNIVCVLYSCCCRVPYSQRTLSTLPQFPYPKHQYFQLPTTRVDKAQPEVAAEILEQGSGA